MNTRKRFPSRLNFESGFVEMAHGSGGRAMAQLIDAIFHRHLGNELLLEGDDAVSFPVEQGRMVMSVDGHVVTPRFFPGGNIGSLAVHGTVNDVAMSGAKPLWLSASFILEEGLPLSELDQIVRSMAEACQEAGVAVITGDTKVVERGKGDGIFISTTGVGVLPHGINISGRNARPGDKILINGSIGDHGVAIMASRENLEFETSIESDSAALNRLVAAMVDACPEIHCLRDPTRGGLASTLNELAQQSGVGMQIDESYLPIKTQVKAACELLGLDPLNVANEGKVVVICPPEFAEPLLDVMGADPLGVDSAIIGEVVEDDSHFVTLRTQFGGTRMVDWIAGEQLPRIC